jgi:hypothetical protein
VTEACEEEYLVMMDREGKYIDARETRTSPQWRVTFQWELVQRLVVDPTDHGVAITIADRNLGTHRVERRDTSGRSPRRRARQARRSPVSDCPEIPGDRAGRSAPTGG